MTSPAVPEIETDKLTSEYTLRVPEFTSDSISKLNKQWKRILNIRILDIMDHTLHEANRQPGRYLKSEYFRRETDAT